MVFALDWQRNLNHGSWLDYDGDCPYDFRAIQQAAAMRSVSHGETINHME
jgi:hypothetical protein